MTKIIKNEFGSLKNGATVYAFTLSDGCSFARILNLGGILQSLVFPDKTGTPTDVVLGYDTPQEYLENDGYLGALIGRFGNRIDEGRLEIDGKIYSLYLNDRGNHLHGGREGFDKKIWDTEIITDEQGNEQLVLRYVSVDGEEHYPGTLVVQVVYGFINGVLSIDYMAVADQKTAINLTNHAYFNLDGDGAENSVSEHFLKINADRITPTDKNMIPRGGFKKVAGTPFDFSSFQKIGDGNARIEEDADMINGNGFDHCFVLNGQNDDEPACVAYSEKSGIEMKTYTDQSAVQLYTSNGLFATGKNGKAYGRFGGFCLETQAIPNNVNVPEYAAIASSIFEKGEPYFHSTRYAFCVRK